MDTTDAVKFHFENSKSSSGTTSDWIAIHLKFSSVTSRLTTNFARVEFELSIPISRDGFTHRSNRPWPRAPRNDLFYDDSMLTKNLQNCAEA